MVFKTGVGIFNQKNGLPQTNHPEAKAVANKHHGSAKLLISQGMHAIDMWWLFKTHLKTATLGGMAVDVVGWECCV